MRSADEDGDVRDIDALAAPAVPTCLSIDQVEEAVRRQVPIEGIERHLQSCPRCRKLYEEIGQNESMLASFARLDSPLLSFALSGCTAVAGIPLGGIAGYRLLGEVHAGGQAVVYRAVQVGTGRTVALKVLLQGRFATSAQRLRFQRGIELGARLRHPAIVTVHGSGLTADGRPYCAMEYIEGQTLDRFLKERGERDAARRRQEPARTRRGRSGAHRAEALELVGLFAKICAGVHHAHVNDVIHRDLKPQNIIIDRRGNPHLCDFGMAKATGRGRWGANQEVSTEGTFAGTFAYAAPEQLTAPHVALSPRTDVYALGVIFFRMITGCLPYRETDSLDGVVRSIAEQEPIRPSLVRPDLVDPGLEAIILCMLAKAPVDRYESAARVRRDLEHWIAREPLTVRRAGRGERAVRTIRRRKWMLILGLSVAAVIALLSIRIGVLSRRLAVAEQRLIDDAGSNRPPGTGAGTPDHRTGSSDRSSTAVGMGG